MTETDTDSTDRIETTTNSNARGDHDHEQVPDGYDLSPDAEATRCEYCGAPFADDDFLALHYGVEHPDEITDAQRTAFEDAYAAETEAIRRFRLKALAVLVVLYFGLLMAFSVFA